MTEDAMVAWHHRLNGHDFEQAPGVGNGQGSLMCCSPRGCKESDMTEYSYDKNELNIPLGFPGGSAIKNPPDNAGGAGSIPGSGRIPGEGNGNHSSILTWEMPWTELGGLLCPCGCKELDMI